MFVKTLNIPVKPTDFLKQTSDLGIIAAFFLSIKKLVPITVDKGIYIIYVCICFEYIYIFFEIYVCICTGSGRSNTCVSAVGRVIIWV